MESKKTISSQDFEKCDIRIGKILSAEKVENADKLFKLEVKFGAEKRQIISGIAEFYKPEKLEGKLCPFILNLEPRIIRGHESQGMILAADADGKPVLIHPDEEIGDGAVVK